MVLTFYISFDQVGVAHELIDVVRVGFPRTCFVSLLRESHEGVEGGSRWEGCMVKSGDERMEG